MLATIAGSNIPDIDTVLKLRNNAKYIRNHRGITHSIPAVILLVIPYKWHLFRLLFRRSISSSTALVIYCCLPSRLCRYFQCLWYTSITAFHKMGRTRRD